MGLLGSHFVLAKSVRHRRDLVGRHLRRVYGPEASGHRIEQKIDDAFASYARYWAESLRLPSLSAEQVDAGMSHRGMDHLYNAQGEGRGVIVALPHLGGWDWGGRWLAEQGLKVSVVVEALEPPEVFSWFVEFRRSIGLEVIPVGPGAARACLAALRAGRVVCLLCDRTVGSTPGVGVEFFGESTALPGGPVTLALRSGAPLLSAAVYFTAQSSGHLALVGEPLALRRSGGLRADVASGTQLLARQLEDLIRRAPTQWHLMSPNWPSDLR